MRLVTINHSIGAVPGVVIDEFILNLPVSAGLIPEAMNVASSVKSILSLGDEGLSAVRQVQDKVTAGGPSLWQGLVDAGALIKESEARLLAPIPDPGLILSCGMNYRGHLAEMGGNLPKTPTAFLKSVNAIVGPNSPIVLPASNPGMVDWEAEFCGVIGRPCHAVTESEALDYVAGYTLINDVSARDWVRPMGELQGLEATAAWDLNLLGKQFPTFCPMGPAVVTKDELIDPAGAAFQLTLNGELKQSACTDDLLFSLAALIAYYSQWYNFQPGDLISTGSPAGVGMGEKPFRFLKSGDVVTLGAEGIGSMSNPVISEAENMDRG